jgi:hypothetical protein
MAGLDPAIFSAAVPVQMAGSDPRIRPGDGHDVCVADAVRQHLGRLVSSCKFACLRSCDGEAGSSTTPLRDEPRHVTPGHRLAIELSDQSKVANGQLKWTVMNGKRSQICKNTAQRFGSTPFTMHVQRHEPGHRYAGHELPWGRWRRNVFLDNAPLFVFLFGLCPLPPNPLPRPHIPIRPGPTRPCPPPSAASSASSAN